MEVNELSDEEAEQLLRDESDPRAREKSVGVVVWFFCKANC
jgi:hypothetical protein